MTWKDHGRASRTPLVSVWEAVAVALAGLAAGTINTVVGSGTLVTFPVLLAVGYPPVLANVTNTVGLVPGSLSGAVGYRRELAGQRRRLSRLAVASVLGGITGAALLADVEMPAATRRCTYVIRAAASAGPPALSTLA